jgi:hypothetical protein
LEGKHLATLERIANNLPIPPGALRQGIVKTDRGDVYLAWGRAADRQWHGVWCLDRGWRKLARTVEHGWALTEATIKQRMLDDAYIIAGMMEKRKLFDESASFDGRP